MFDDISKDELESLKKYLSTALFVVMLVIVGIALPIMLCLIHWIVGVVVFIIEIALSIATLSWIDNEVMW